jgi:hypothetical protein
MKAPRTHLPPLLLFVSYALFLLWQFSPGLFSSKQTAPGAYFDIYHFIWNVWFLRERTDTEAAYFTTLLFWPTGTSLYLHTLTEGILWPMARIVRKASPWWVYTASCALCLLLNWCSFCLLYSRICASGVCAALLATVLALHPFWYAHLDGGHLNMLVFFPIPLCLYCLLRAHVPGEHSTKSHRYGWLLAGGLCLAFLPFTNLYYFYFLLLLLGIVLGFGVATRNAQLLTAIIVTVCTGLVASGWRLYQTALAAFSGVFAPNHDPASNSLNLAQLVVPGTYQRIANLLATFPSYAQSPNSSETGGYIGIALISLLIYILLQSRHAPARWAVTTAGIFTMLSIGPEIRVGDLASISNPLFHSLSWLPLFPSVPARFVSIAVFAACCALAIFSRDHLRLVVFISLLCALDWLPTPIFWRQGFESPLLQRVRTTAISAIHDATPSLELRMLHQTIHQKPITAGFIARVPRSELKRVRRNPLIAYLEERSNDYLTDRGRADMKALQVDAILVPRHAPGTIQRASSVGALREYDHDDHFVLFGLATE